MATFGFRLKLKKSKSPVKKEWRRYTNSFFYGRVAINSHGDFVCVVRVDGETKELEFTPNSYILKDRQRVFARDNLKLSLIRLIDDCHYKPGDVNRYVPFAPKWIVKGLVMLDIDDNMWFEFKDLITIEGYNYPKDKLV